MRTAEMLYKWAINDVTGTASHRKVMGSIHTSQTGAQELFFHALCIAMCSGHALSEWQNLQCTEDRPNLFLTCFVRIVTWCPKE